MSDRRTRMIEDQYLRDSARALVEADIEHLKSDFANKTLGERAIDRMREGATDLYEEAIDVAEDNKGALAALVAAIVVWFARNPILEVFGLAAEPEDDPKIDDDAER
ncbi:MAG: hypothetical protein AB3N06_09045 [Erythrobacter sp.]